MSHTKKKKKRRDEEEEREKGSGGYMWCHQCKQKHGQVIYCSRSCSKKYCTRCVERHYREKVSEIDQSEWICYYCQGVCSCAFCRRRRAKETNTKFESHRGKKRRIAVEVPEHSMKKHKSKSYDYDSDSTKEKDKKHPKDDWIVQDEEPLKSRFDSKNNKKVSKNKSRNDRVTLKDLLDTEILSPNDELIFRDTQDIAILLPDAQIKWGDKTYRNISILSQKISTSGDFNLWRMVYCRNKPLDSYRQQYLKITDSDSKYSGSDNAEDNEDEEFDIGEVFEDNHINDQSNENDEELEEEEELDKNGNNESIKFSEDQPTEVIIKKDRYLKLKILRHQINQDHTTDYTLDDDHIFEIESSPVHQLLLDDSYVFSSLPPILYDTDEDNDILIMGNSCPVFLDIEDKYFFPITTFKDENNLSIQIRYSHHMENGVSGNHYGESVEDFYNVNVGIDTEIC